MLAMDAEPASPTSKRDAQDHNAASSVARLHWRLHDGAKRRTLDLFLIVLLGRVRAVEQVPGHLQQVRCGQFRSFVLLLPPRFLSCARPTGTLDPGEIAEMLRDYLLHNDNVQRPKKALDREVKDALTNYDADGNGVLSFTEFIRLMCDGKVGTRLTPEMRLATLVALPAFTERQAYLASPPSPTSPARVNPLDHISIGVLVELLGAIKAFPLTPPKVRQTSCNGRPG
jgi:hypothetical protein